MLKIFQSWCWGHSLQKPEKEQEGPEIAMAEVETPDNLNDLRAESEERESGSKHGSSTSDISSIEALSWSDLEDDLNDDEMKLLQSIHSQGSDKSENGENSGLRNRNKTLTQEDDTTITESATTLKNESQSDDGDQNSSMKNSEIPVIMATSTHSVASELLAFDTVSNVPVLDDGPIWAKGSKLYKFEENRRFNQKLTFCVLFSVVLAVGLGIGNLAAYNECEAEHKSSTMGNLDENIGPSMEEMSGKASLVQPESRLSNVNPIPSPQISKQPETIPIVEPKPIKVDKPMIDPQYAAHAEELARVLKMLDELSRKIDRFENTTRQLGGIVMLRDDIIHPDSATKKSKFLGLLDEIMKEKGKKQKKGLKEDIEQPLNWRAKKEQVLDEIAEAVLGAMDVHEESFRENKGKEAKLEVEPTFQSYTEPDDFHPKSVEVEVEKIIPEDTKVFIEDELPETTLEVEPTLEKLITITDQEETKKFKKERKNKAKKPKHSRGEQEDEVSPGKVSEKRKKRHTPKPQPEESDSPKPPKTKRSHNEKKKNRKSESYNSTGDVNKNGKNKSCREKDKKEKEKKEKRQESFKNKKNKFEIKSDSKDWQAARAKFRQEGRAKLMTSWNKKVNNWMSDRYEEREKLRNKKFS